MIRLLRFVKSLFFKNKNEDDYFYIEYYPITGYYYARYKDYYLSRHYASGLIKMKDDIHLACSRETEEGAKKMIAEFKEQRFKKSVIIIKEK